MLHLSLAALHRAGAYTHLMSEEDRENLEWLKIFKYACSRLGFCCNLTNSRVLLIARLTCVRNAFTASMTSTARARSGSMSRR